MNRKNMKYDFLEIASNILLLKSKSLNI